MDNEKQLVDNTLSSPLNPTSISNFFNPTIIADYFDRHIIGYRFSKDNFNETLFPDGNKKYIGLKISKSLNDLLLQFTSIYYENQSFYEEVPIIDIINGAVNIDLDYNHVENQQNVGILFERLQFLDGIEFVFFSKIDLDFLMQNQNTTDIVISLATIIRGNFGYTKVDPVPNQFFTLKIEGDYMNSTDQRASEAYTERPIVIFGAPCPPVWYNIDSFHQYLNFLGEKLYGANKTE